MNEFDDIIARFISKEERDKAKDSDFVDSERRSFPIIKSGDVKAAVHSWGRYKGSMSFEEFKAKLTRIAHRKGFENELPDEWKNDTKKSKSSLDFEVMTGQLERIKDKIHEVKSYVDVVCMPDSCCEIGRASC